jgi:hypothetical protein
VDRFISATVTGSDHKRSDPRHRVKLNLRASKPATYIINGLLPPIQPPVPVDNDFYRSRSLQVIAQAKVYW